MTLRDLVPFNRKSNSPARRSNYEIRPSLSRGMDSFFEDAFKDWLDLKTSIMPELFSGENEFSPQIDIQDHKNKCVIKAELPGVDGNDIDISVENGMLMLKGEKKSEKETNEKGWNRYECSYGSFYRSIPLPENVDEDQIDASFKNGVLKLAIPKTQTSEAKRIQVKTE